MIISPLAKVKSVSDLQPVVASLKAQGHTVVFGNGCFDLIHVGHVRYLQGARALGDRLVVGLNSDESVRGLKGPGRPLQSEGDRAEMLASFECVDYVVVFDDPTVEAVLLSLRPDIHAKGTDYTKESVPEKDTVRSYGGKVAIVGDPKEHSSRDLIGTVVARFAHDSLP
jgi:D-glycero-beta-D-manno-heptose 1-phosphate adenylyltransferase